MRFPLNSDQILGAMESRQMPTSGVQVKMAAPVTASVAHPQIDIKSVAVISSQVLRLRVVCSNQAECLPFFVLAEYPEPVHSEELQVKLEHRASVTQVVQAAPPTMGRKLPAASNFELRAGSVAMLNMDGGRVHITVKVICLQNGSIGDKIHVSSSDRKQSYMAQIVTPELLQGDI